MANDDLSFEFEAHLEHKQITAGPGADNRQLVDIPPQELIGQQPGNYRKNFKKTVCTYWLRGMCMKGDTCGFLHQFDVDKMPICRNLLKFGECKELDCPYKHDTEEIKECNMYKLGFCIYGPQCRFKHKPAPGPPPAIEGVEAAKPLGSRDINRVVNSVNPGVLEDQRPLLRNTRWAPEPAPALMPDAKRPRQLGWNNGFSNTFSGPTQERLALPAPPSTTNPSPAAGAPPAAPPGPRPPPGGPRPPSHPPPPHLGGGPKPPQTPADGQQGPGQPQPPQHPPPQQQQQGGGMPNIMPSLMPGAGGMGHMGGMHGMGAMGQGFMQGGMGPMGMMGNPLAMMGMLGPAGMMGAHMNPGMMMGQGHMQQGMGNMMGNMGNMQQHPGGQF